LHAIVPTLRLRYAGRAAAGAGAAGAAGAGLAHALGDGAGDVLQPPPAGRRGAQLLQRLRLVGLPRRE
jgi:hypothetical protein